MQKAIEAFKREKWVKEFSKNKGKFLSQLRSFSSYKDVDWKAQDSNTIMEFCISGNESGAINVLEAFAIFHCGEQMKCKRFVEIGRMGGRSTRLFAVMAKRIGGTILSIDGISSKRLSKLFKDFNLLDCTIFEDNWSPWINLPLPFDEIDFLFIDGDHSFISAIVDYHFFNYFVKKNGIIGFHDLNIKGVREAVDKIIERDNLEELCRISRLRLYKKIQEVGEKYFQLLDNKKFNRERLSRL